MPAIVAIVGRPNVGKSTLFNRLLRQNLAIIHDEPGVTRDRLYAETEIGGRRVALVDTGGLTVVETPGADVREGIFNQAREAVEEAQAILLVMDGREGLTPLDQSVAEFIRRSGKPTLLAVNKVDGEEQEGLRTAEFHALGFPLAPVSAAHGFGLDVLRERLAGELLASVPEPEESHIEAGLRLAMLGRPNAGKSSMINALIGKNRLLVSAEAGTTRDAVDVTFERDGKRYTFVDTAGVRKKTKVEEGLEHFSVLRALAASKRADVVVLVLSANEGLTTQDKKLVSFLDKEKTPFLIAVNKLDLVPRAEGKEVKEMFRRELKIAAQAPILFTSTLTRTGLSQILPLAETIDAECKVRVSTGELNRAMRKALDKHQPPVVKFKRAKFYYLTQVESTPPTFIFFVNNKELIKPSYQRYLENSLRKLFGLTHAPVRVFFKSSHAE
jgi:GTP-binding protein